jgi:hypothetical protein
MGVRGEIFSKKVILPNRTYFFNIKENRMGDIYLNIVESKNRETGGFDRQSIILFAEDLQEFLQGFDESLQTLEDLIRKQRKGSRNEDGGRGERGAYPPDDGKRASARNSYPGDRKKPADREDYPRSDRKRSADRDTYPRSDRKRSADRDTYPRSDRKRPADRDTYPRSDRKRPAERGAYPPSGRKRTSERGDYIPADRKRPPKGAEQFSRPAHEGKRVIVRKTNRSRD